MIKTQYLQEKPQAVSSDLLLGMQMIISATNQVREYPYNFPKHIHKSIEIYLIDSGECSMDINNKKFTFQKDDFIIIYPNTVHSLYLDTENTCAFRHIHFDPVPFSHWLINQNEFHTLTLMNALIMPYEHYQHLTADKKISDLIYNIIEETAEEDHLLSTAMANLHLAELTLHLIKRTHPDLSLTADSPSHTPEHIRYVSYVLSYIHENFSKKILIPDIASHLNISSRYLSKIFFHHMNLTILNYINIYRINHAIELMLNTNLTLTNIAELVGLKDSQHFSKLFKNTIGIPPNQYRKLILHDISDEASEKDFQIFPDDSSF